MARLKASTKTRELCIRELLFADDAAIVAHTLEDIREICKQFDVWVGGWVGVWVDGWVGVWVDRWVGVW